MSIISQIAKWALENLNGPMAALLVSSNAWWIWFVLRLRKETKAANGEFIATIVEKEKSINAEKDARREEALNLQSKGYESISKLVTLMDRVEGALVRVEKTMVRCMRNDR